MCRGVGIPTPPFSFLEANPNAATAIIAAPHAWVAPPVFRAIGIGLFPVVVINTEIHLRRVRMPVFQRYTADVRGIRRATAKATKRVTAAEDCAGRRICAISIGAA